VGNAQELGEFVNAIEKNNIKPVIDNVFSFDKVQDAFQRFKSGEAFGKVVVKL
jgi:NADPH:quinone reductase-like Zn-dependent oxidoreductase